VTAATPPATASAALPVPGDAAPGSSGSSGAPLSLKCGQCDAPVIPGEKFCVRCGSGLTWRICGSCEAPAYEFAHFCQSCGNSLDIPEEEAGSTGPAPGAPERPVVIEIENPVYAWLRMGLTQPDSRPYFYMTMIVLGLILLSIMTIVLDSIASVRAQYGTVLNALETVLLIGFTLEYILNVMFTVPRRKYVLSFWGIADFLAIVPGFLSGLSVNLTEFRIVRLLRVLRVLRVLKLAKLARRRPDADGRPLPRTMQEDWQLYGVTAVCVVIISATMLYYAEGETSPQAFPDIPSTMWWAWLIITSAGQDAIMPVTLVGRLIAVATLFAGLAQFAMLIAIVARQLQRMRQEEDRVRASAERAAQRMAILAPRKPAPAPKA
jgi:voltage-gated potassium channel